MNNWTAHIQINGLERSWFTDYEFEISNSQKEAINTAIKNNTPIKELDCYNQLVDQAASVVDYYLE